LTPWFESFIGAAGFVGFSLSFRDFAVSRALSLIVEALNDVEFI
jgi:hypothetical protein